MDSIWQRLGERLAARQAGTIWGLPLTLLVALVLPLGFFFALRGLRGALLYLGGVGGVVLFAAAFAYPFPALLVGVFLGISGLDAYLPGPASFAILLVVAGRATFEALGGRRLDWGSALHRASLLVLVALALTSFAYARNLRFAFDEAGLIVSGIVSYMAIAGTVRTQPRLYRLALLVCVAFCLANVMAVAKMTSRGGLAWLAVSSEIRIQAGGWDSNVAAVFANSLVPVAAFLTFAVRGWRRAAMTVILLLLAASVVLSASRAGLAVLVLVFGAILASGRRYRPLAITCALLVGATLVFLPAHWQRFTSVGQLGGIVVDRSLQLRQEALQAGARMFRENWLLGVGLGNFQVESTRFLSTQVMAHNTFLEVAVNLGSLGLVAYLAWLGSGVGMTVRAGRLRRAARDANGAEFARMMGFGILVFCIGAMAVSIPFYPLLWLLLGLANGARVAAEREDRVAAIAADPATSG